MVSTTLEAHEEDGSSFVLRTSSFIERMPKVELHVHLEGAIAPVVGKTVPFDQIPQALATLAAGGARGKVVATR